MPPTPLVRAALEPLEAATLSGAKWSWACRVLGSEAFDLDGTDRTAPRPGDLALFQIVSLGYHTSVVTADNRKLRIYPGDLIVGVFGHRYATDAYEAHADSLEELSLLTAGGMVGRILSRHREVGKPTTVTFRGYLRTGEGARANLKDLCFRPIHEAPIPRNLIVVVGTGMNAGKTTVASQLIHHLTRRGLRVAALKITGSVSNRDSDEMRAADAADVRDFSDYGFPSTFLAGVDELAQLWATMLSDAERVVPDVTVVEIADGILQRETEMILRDPEFRRRVRGVVLASDSALGALAAVERLEGLRYRVLAVSGAFTSAPLYIREFAHHSAIPVASSAGEGGELGTIVHGHLDGAGPRVPTEGAEPTGGRSLIGSLL